MTQISSLAADVPRARPMRRAVRLALAGMLLGAVILGGGGRAAMRVIAIRQGRVPTLTAAGVLTVVAFGSVFGLAAGIARYAVEQLLSRRFAPRTRAALWHALTIGLATIVLTPLTPLRLALFLPIVTIFLFALARVDRDA